jgi:hypothetical protein
MKVRFALLGVLLLLPGLLYGQAPTPTPAPVEPPISHLILTGSAASFKSSTGTNPASIMYAGLQVTKTFSAGYEQLTVSGLPIRGQFGVATYSNTLDTFLGKTISSHLVFDSSNIVLTVGGGLGKWLTPQKNNIAETFHVSLTYPLTTHLGWQLFGYQVFHAPKVFLGVNYTQTLSTGPVLYF